MNKKLIFSAVLVCMLLATVVGVAFAQTSPNVVRWEYRIIAVRSYDNLEPTMNRLGAEGWEFVGAPGTGSSLFFKRRLP